MNNIYPKYPIFIISKGRWESRLTVKALEKMKVNYKIVIEPQEYKQYSEVINKENILVLPFSNLGQGSIPARNWVWEYAVSLNVERYWILDDNINGFGRFNYNMKIKANTPAVFRIVEDFTDRYKNVALSGMHYDYFIVRKEKLTPYILNTRIYSCILIRTDLNYRWRGKYNEDTDLSLRILKDGWCTILFRVIFCFKVPTLIMQGGNTDAVYNDGTNRFSFAESLQKQHPDVVKIVKKYGRYHHQVDYRSFKNNKLIKKDNLIIPDRINNYNMILKNKEEIKNEN